MISSRQITDIQPFHAGEKRIKYETKEDDSVWVNEWLFNAFRQSDNANYTQMVFC